VQHATALHGTFSDQLLEAAKLGSGVAHRHSGFRACRRAVQVMMAVLRCSTWAAVAAF
jgi:hypothetical protein